MDWTLVLESEKETAASTEGFWSAVDVWLKRPHVVNRRLVGAVVVQEGGGVDEWIRKQLEAIYKDSGWAPTGVSCGGHGVRKFLVRELLPRMQGLPPNKEAVFIGMTQDTSAMHTTKYCCLLIYIDMESLSASFHPLISPGSDGKYSCGGFYKFQYFPAADSASPRWG